MKCRSLCDPWYPFAMQSCHHVCRQTFWEQYSKAANDAAQALAARRSKETAVRDVFKRAVAKLINPQVGIGIYCLQRYLSYACIHVQMHACLVLE